MEVILCIIIGYFIGGINPSYIYARMQGFDIRERGSGNAGASNAMITIGRGTGAVMACLDIFKAYLAVKLSAYIFPTVKLAGIITGTSCILGHVFPLFMKFKGGKGLACLGGVILAYSVPMFFILLTVEAILGFSLDYLVVVPITGSIAFPIIYGILEKSIKGALILGIAAVVMQFKHIENLKRISNGTEARLSFLWKGDKELERVKENAEKN